MARAEAAVAAAAARAKMAAMEDWKYILAVEGDSIEIETIDAY
jgi:hypothetical protein